MIIFHDSLLLTRIKQADSLSKYLFLIDITFTLRNFYSLKLLGALFKDQLCKIPYYFRTKPTPTRMSRSPHRKKTNSKWSRPTLPPPRRRCRRKPRNQTPADPHRPLPRANPHQPHPKLINSPPPLRPPSNCPIANCPPNHRPANVSTPAESRSPPPSLAQ